MEYGGHDTRSYSWGTGETWCRVGAGISSTNSTSACISFEGAVCSGNSSTGGGSYHRISGYGVTCTVSTSSGGSSSNSSSYNYSSWVANTSGTVWVSREHSNKTVTVTCSYSSYNGASNSGSVSTSVTIPKKDSYTIKFNANGGSGGPGNYTKWPGENLDIPSTIPTRENYRFDGWATSSTATSATYQAGKSYSGTKDENYTLYAVWTLLYKAPTAVFVEGHRVDSATSTSESALGTYMRMQFNWNVDTSIYPENVVKTIAATAVLSDSSTPTCTISGTTSGTSGTIYVVAPIATNLSGTIAIVVTDTAKEGTGTANGSVGLGHIPFEVANGGTSIGILNSAGDANSITLGGLRLTDVHADDMVTIPLKKLILATNVTSWVWYENRSASTYDAPSNWTGIAINKIKQGPSNYSEFYEVISRGGGNGIKCVRSGYYRIKLTVHGYCASRIGVGIFTGYDLTGEEFSSFTYSNGSAINATMEAIVYLDKDECRYFGEYGGDSWTKYLDKKYTYQIIEYLGW